MRIGELVRRAQVTPRTVRYYESIGLLPAGEREGGGQHRYTEEAVLRLRKIEQLKQLGLSLDEIADVLELYFTRPSGVRSQQRVLAILRLHLDEVEQRRRELNQLRSELKAHIQRCEGWLEEKKRR